MRYVHKTCRAWRVADGCLSFPPEIASCSPEQLPAADTSEMMKMRETRHYAKSLVDLRRGPLRHAIVKDLSCGAQQNLLMPVPHGNSKKRHANARARRAQRRALRLILHRVWEWAFLLEHLAEITAIDPTAGQRMKCSATLLGGLLRRKMVPRESLTFERLLWKGFR